MWYSEVQHPDGPQMPLKHTLVDDLDGHVREETRKIKVTTTKAGGAEDEDRDISARRLAELT